jgi:hypothetical protein
MPSDLLMPADELVEFAARAVIGTVLEAVPQLIFNKYVARYFHGVGRHALMLITFGTLRIPSSLRMVPPGTKPKPTGQDWLALCVGIVTWGAAAACTYFAYFGF